MFQLDQIKEAHSKVKSGADFPAYIKEIKTLGVLYYDTYVNDGHAEYYGEKEYKISSPAKYEQLTIADETNVAGFKQGLKEHQQGRSNYQTFCEMCADSGIEKWSVGIEEMTCTYYDKAGGEILKETIPG